MLITPAHYTNQHLIKALVYMLHQDDPFKCTASKLARFGLARQVRYIPRNSIALNPFSHLPITRADSLYADSICAIDCSWEKADDVLKHRRVLSSGIGRRIPAMLAANPTNYAKIGKLSSAEALAGSLYIAGEKNLAGDILNKFKWGHTFLELNSELLEDYFSAQSAEEVAELEKAYFPNLA